MPDGSRLAVPVKGEAVRFPFIPLSRAIDRAREIFQASSRGQHPILVLDAQKLWGYTEKASGGFQTVAASEILRLVSYIGNKDRRQLKLTDDARRLFLDECPEVHLKIFKKLAIAPQAFSNLGVTGRLIPLVTLLHAARSRLSSDMRRKQHQNF